MGKQEIIYGIGHGDLYTEQSYDDSGEKVGEPKEKTFWAPRIEVNNHEYASRGVGVRMCLTDQDTGEPDPETWVSVELSWDGCNRLIRAVRQQRDRHFGKAE